MKEKKIEVDLHLHPLLRIALGLPLEEEKE